MTEQLSAALPDDWAVTLLAVDGHVTGDIPKQLRRLPADALHLLVSSGGNDALTYSQMLDEPASTVADALKRLTGIREEFRRGYQRMLKKVPSTGHVLACCTIYDCIPLLESEAITALGLFDEVILREALPWARPSSICA